MPKLPCLGGPRLLRLFRRGLLLLFLVLAWPGLAEAQGFRYTVLPATGSGILMTLDPAWLEEGPLPLRQDPKVLVLVYHNLVFGRKGGPTNRDIHNFQSELAVLTFDDGDLSVYAIAYPLLRRFGIKATFFIVPSLVGEVGYISWDQLREMSAYVDPLRDRLFTFGSHTQSPEARTLAQLDLMAIGSFSMDSSNSDLLVKKLVTMVGR